jgi:AAA family ATP:ADP antiporter
MQSDPRKGPLDRFLSLFADVHGGEGVTAFLLMATAFLLLAAYYLVKPLREALILGNEGAEVKSYSSAVQAVLLLLLVPAYGRLASKVGRIRLITWVSLFFMSNLVVFDLLGMAGVKGLGIPFFMWVGIFNVMIVAQFWAFANDVYTPEQGKRLFAVVAIGSSLGAIAGAAYAKNLIEAIGVFQPMLIAAGILGACVVLAHLVHRRHREGHGVAGEPTDAEAPLGPEGGFKLVFQQRYLLLIALFILVLNTVNTTGEYILGKTIGDEAARHTAALAGAAPGSDPKEQWIGAFYADFFFWVNLVGAIGQLFLVGRIMKWFGVRVALFVLPVIALGGYGLLATAPILAYIRGVKIAENATDYSLNNTARHALFLPTSREAKYKAKAAIDSFFWRMGDLVSAGIVFVSSQLAFGVRQVSMINLGFVLIWLGIVFAIGREYQVLAREREREQPEPATPSPAIARGPRRAQGQA